MGFNSSQKIPTFTKGEVLRADSLSHLVAAMKRMIVGGPGVEVKPMRDQIAINIKQGPIPRAGGGGETTPPSTTGRMSCPTVYSLPAVPTTAATLQFVYWTSADEPHEEGDPFQEGTGDNQVWWTRTDLTRWYPMTYSTLNGTPGEDEL